MKKLKLDLDRLVVECFEAEPARANREGTVRGHQSGTQTCEHSCAIWPCTDWDTCGGTCYPCA